MGHRDQQSESVSVDRRDKQNWFSVWSSVCKAKWFPRRKRMNSIKRTFIQPWMSFERSSPGSCNNNRHPLRRRPVGDRQGNAPLEINVCILLVQSADDSISPVLHLLVQRLKPVLSEELVQQVRTTYQFNIATLGSFYLDLKNGESNETCRWIDASLLMLGAGSCAAGLCPLPSVDVTITLANPEDLRLLSTGNSNDLVQAYLSQRITIDGSLQDALHLKNLTDALRRENILLFNASSK